MQPICKNIGLYEEQIINLQQKVLAEARSSDRNTPDNMKKVKITILKTMLNEDLAKEYGICGLKACPMMKVGDVFYADYAKPEGFCDEAWKAIYQYVFALAHGAAIRN